MTATDPKKINLTNNQERERWHGMCAAPERALLSEARRIADAMTARLTPRDEGDYFD